MPGGASHLRGPRHGACRAALQRLASPYRREHTTGPAGPATRAQSAGRITAAKTRIAPRGNVSIVCRGLNRRGRPSTFCPRMAPLPNTSALDDICCPRRRTAKRCGSDSRVGLKSRGQSRGSRSRRTQNNDPSFYSQGEEKNEGLHPHIWWTKIPDFVHVYRSILPMNWVFFLTAGLCLVRHTQASRVLQRGQ
jgi:hypothetical protein